MATAHASESTSVCVCVDGCFVFVASCFDAAMSLLGGELLRSAVCFVVVVVVVGDG